jgi:hypothetical protein
MNTPHLAKLNWGAFNFLETTFRHLKEHKKAGK